MPLAVLLSFPSKVRIKRKRDVSCGATVFHLPGSLLPPLAADDTFLLTPGHMAKYLRPSKPRDWSGGGSLIAAGPVSIFLWDSSNQS